MIRRPPTSIVLKMDDVTEYELLRKEQETNKDQSKSTKSCNQVPSTQIGPKSKQEIHTRIGYNPSNDSTANMNH